MYHSEAKRKAKEKLRGNWGNAILVGFIYSIASGIGSSRSNYSHNGHISSINLVAIALSLLVSPVIYGTMKYFMGLIRDERVYVSDIFNSYKEFSRIVIATLVRNILIFLWTLLFIVPGIMKAYSYSMMYNIMNDNPEMSGSEALKMSEEIMLGHRMDLFTLYMVTIGWAVIPLSILSVILIIASFVMIFGGVTALIGMGILIPIIAILVFVLLIITLWLQPLYMVAKSYFYEDVRREYMYNREVQ